MNDLSEILKSIERSRGYKTVQASLSQFKFQCLLEHKRKVDAAKIFKRNCLSELVSHKKKVSFISKKNNAALNDITTVKTFLEEISTLVTSNGFKINSISPSSSVYVNNFYSSSDEDYSWNGSSYNLPEDPGKFKVSITRDIGNGAILNYKGFLHVKKNYFYFTIKEKGRLLFWIKYTKVAGVQHKNRMLEALLGRKRKLCL